MRVGYGHEGLTLPDADFSRDFATTLLLLRETYEKKYFKHVKSICLKAYDIFVINFRIRPYLYF